jgi:hypothetical protein
MDSGDTDDLDWDFLSRVRDGFLSASSGVPDYWEGHASLASYHATFGERIGLKWDAVIDELHRIRWEPPAGPLVDFGCGTGIAAGRVLQAWPGKFTRVLLHDRSPAARHFAAITLSRLHPGVTIETAGAGEWAEAATTGTLLASHVWNELGATHRRTLLQAATHASAMIWVEPGTKEGGREMSATRDKLASARHIIAPCPHQGPCGMLREGMEDHWCHHFAFPPTEAFVSARWRDFSEILGIDLRRLPYWYVVLDERAPVLPEGLSRLTGLPVVRKHGVAWWNCDKDGVSLREVTNRQDKSLATDIRKAKAGPWFQPGQGAAPPSSWPVPEGESPG